jgi:hypothetical protein
VGPLLRPYTRILASAALVGEFLPDLSEVIAVLSRINRMTNLLHKRRCVCHKGFGPRQVALNFIEQSQVKIRLYYGLLITYSLSDSSKLL